eukprot:4557201-Pyramimonas_sp.AAC.1
MHKTPQHILVVAPCHAPADVAPFCVPEAIEYPAAPRNHPEVWSGDNASPQAVQLCTAGAGARPWLGCLAVAR